MLDRRAYICHARADKAAAMRLRRRLAQLSPPPGDDGVADSLSFGPVLPVELGAAPLGRALRFDLEASDWLILICSPASLTPAMAEAAMIFRARGRAHRIIPVVLSGEPGASRTPGLSHHECLPRPLLFAADAAGVLTDHPATINFVDQRPDGLSLTDAAAHVAARITGAPLSRFQAAADRRLRRRGLVAGVAAAAALVALTLAPVLVRDMQALSRAEAARAAGLAAHQALDEGRQGAALAALTRAFPRSFDFAAPPYPVPDEALSALNRAALETRALADLPAPAPDIARLVPTEGGALVAITADAGAHLIDPGAGETLQVHAPGRGGASRVSTDGATLWTARFGADARNEDGDVYAPLIFENVDLTSGETTLTTAVQSLPPGGGAAAISPDGQRFAVDLGPGQGDRTLIAVFSRTEQALAAVTTLPGDRATVAFLGPDRLLLTTNPPNIFGAAPGLYLWRLDEKRPRVLRAPGRTPACPGAHGAPRRAIAAELAAGRLPVADWAVSDDGAEIALLLPSLAGGSCLLRWDARTGRRAPMLEMRRRYRSLAFLLPGGAYAAMPDNGDLALIGPFGETALTGCDGAARLLGGGAEPLILCEGDGGTTLHHGLSGQRRWRGPALPPLEAAIHDPREGRLFMARRDGRITVWDAAPRSYPVARTAAAATLTQPDKSHVAVLVEGAAPDIFDLAGGRVNPAPPTLLARIHPFDQPQLLALAATGAPAEADGCAPLVAADVIHRSDSPSGKRAAIETAEGLAIYDRATCLPVARFAARTTGSGPMLVSDDLLWAPLPGEIAVFPLTVPPEKALASLHSRALRLAAN